MRVYENVLQVEQVVTGQKLTSVSIHHSCSNKSAFIALLLYKSEMNVNKCIVPINTFTMLECPPYVYQYTHFNRLLCILSIYKNLLHFTFLQVLWSVIMGGSILEITGKWGKVLLEWGTNFKLAQKSENYILVFKAS